MSKTGDVDPYVIQNSPHKESLNHELSGRYGSSDGESVEDRLIFDFPKSNPNYNESWFNDMEQRLDYSDSHGVEGNPGGTVTRHRETIQDKGNFYRLYDITTYILDV